MRVVFLTLIFVLFTSAQPKPKSLITSDKEINVLMHRVAFKASQNEIDKEKINNWLNENGYE